MLIFNKIKLEDIKIINDYYTKYFQNMADYTSCGYCLWREYFSSEYAISHNTLVLKIKSDDYGYFFTMPLGEDISFVIDEIKQYSYDNNINTVFFPISKQNINVLNKYIECETVLKPEYCDYVYDYNSLKNLSGRKLHSQKNHYNYFVKNFSDYKVEKVKNDDLDILLNFLNEVEKNETIDTDFHKTEFIMTKEMLINNNYYQFDIYKLIYKNKIIGFIAGEKMNNTIFIHFQKMDRTYRGSYQALLVEYLNKYNSYDDIMYVNMEDAAMDENLIYTKKCYNPIYLVDKYVLKVKSFI